MFNNNKVEERQGGPQVQEYEYDQEEYSVGSEYDDEGSGHYDG